MRAIIVVDVDEGNYVADVKIKDKDNGYMTMAVYEHLPVTVPVTYSKEEIARFTNVDMSRPMKIWNYAVGKLLKEGEELNEPVEEKWNYFD